jgi:hypothetical protein
MLVRLGVTNIIVSKLILVAIAMLPLLDISGTQRATFATGLVIAMPLLFWSGVALVGRESWRVARRRGWRAVPRELWTLLRHGRPAPAVRADAQSAVLSQPR